MVKATFKAEGSSKRVKRHCCIFFPITRVSFPLGCSIHQPQTCWEQSCSPFLEGFLSQTKNGGEGCGKAHEIWSFSCVQEKQELAGDAIRAEPTRGECSCASLCAAPAADLLSPRPALAAVALLAGPEGSARPPHRVFLISDFRDAGTMQLHIKGLSGARGMQEERMVPGPTGAVGVRGAQSPSAPSGQFGSSLADESGAQLQLSGQGSFLWGTARNPSVPSCFSWNAPWGSTCGCCYTSSPSAAQHLGKLLPWAVC